MPTKMMNSSYRERNILDFGENNTKLCNSCLKVYNEMWYVATLISLCILELTGDGLTN
jgi:hypothetical protein